jgi:patatin-like phospholipase/acyl hydrolase
MAERYHVLSLDGGGIRGLLTSRILARLETTRPGFVDSADLIAGTSAGGIIALGLAAGMKPEEACTLFRDRGPEIFPADLGDLLGDIDRLAVADYPDEPLKTALTDTFGDMTLGELEKHVVIATFDLDTVVPGPDGFRTWKPKFFQNFESDPGDRDELVVDVAMRTSAAPSYFPMYQGYVDGGVVASNPSMCGLAQALDHRAAGEVVSRVALLSVGSGTNPRFVQGYDYDWGLLQWAPNLVGIMLGGVAGVADFQCRQILGTRYLRVDPILPEDIGLDAVDRIPDLERIGEDTDLDAAARWVTTHFGVPDPAKAARGAAGTGATTGGGAP